MRAGVILDVLFGAELLHVRERDTAALQRHVLPFFPVAATPAHAHVMQYLFGVSDELCLTAFPTGCPDRLIALFESMAEAAHSLAERERYLVCAVCCRPDDAALWAALAHELQTCVHATSRGCV